MKRLPILAILPMILFHSCSSGTKEFRKEPFLKVLSMNIFDQQQGKWSNYFRDDRLDLLAARIQHEDLQPDMVFFQESQAKGISNKRFISTDYKHFLKDFSYFKYTHESLGKKDGMSYGYLILSKFPPKQIITDSFHFEGGEERTIQASVWDIKELSKEQYDCVAVVNLHLSHQGSKVRYQEAEWLHSWIEKRKGLCPNWLLVGDFNADETTPEMEYLFEKGYQNLFRLLKSTVFPSNKIRAIYDNVEPKTIDWALATGFRPEARVVLDDEYNGQWLSDHAGVWVEVF